MRDHKALRKKAEERFGEKSSQSLEDLDSLSPEETRRMFHDLRVHQIELKMQNEELRTTQEALDASLARYVDLYEFAPVGYVTLSEQGLILEANLTAATLLGQSRSNLVNQPITGFILKEDQDIYYWHRKQFFESGERQECELRMVKKDGATFWAQLDTIAVTNPTCGPVCSVMINNITIRKQAEVLLLEKKKLQGVLEMAGAICHELSQPLQVISGFSSILLMDINESSPLYKPIKGIEAGITRADILMKKIMGITRYQSKPYLKNNIVDIEKASHHGKE